MNRTLRPAIVLGLLLSGATAAAQTPSPDELIAKHLAAKGGADKLKAINSIRLTGTITVQGNDMAITVLTKRPNRMRQEVTAPGGKVVQAYDGQQVWGINPMFGSSAPRVLEGPQADAIKSQSLFDGPLVGYKERGDTLEVMGQAEVDGAKAWKLKLTRKDGRAMHIYLDANTGLERQWSTTMEQNGLTAEIDTFMSDHQVTDGIQVARTLRTLMGGQPVGLMKITTVEFNAPIDDSLFVMPK
jgi:outer membrane lipoprotein-sorting protein